MGWCMYTEDKNYYINKIIISICFLRTILIQEDHSPGSLRAGQTQEQEAAEMVEY